MRRQTAKPQRNRGLQVEQLEPRIVLDGGVRAFVSGGTLFIQGDSAANEIVVEQSKLRSFRVSSGDGTTLINGQANPRSFFGVSKDLNISLGRGNDVVEIVGTADDAVTVSNRLFVNTSHGDDQVLFTEVHAIGIHIDTGSGNDVVNVGDSGAEGGLEVTKEALILTGSGEDQLSIANSLFKRFLTLNMGNNNDETTLQDTRVRTSSTIIGSSGFDTVNRQGNSGQLKYVSYERINNTVQTPAPIAPVATNDAASVVRGSNVTVNVAANDTSATSALNLASIAITQQPTSGTVSVNNNGTVTYTNNSGAAATDSFQYTIRDQQGNVSNVATVAVSVVNVFAAVNDAGTITEDAAPNTTTGNVLTNDTGGVGTRTVTAVNGSTTNVGISVAGQFGTFQINANGSFTYTLDNTNATVNALNAGQTLTDTMPYTANAGGGASSTANVTITIQGATDPTPVVAVDDTGTVTEDATPNTTTGNVLTNDTGGGTKTVSAVNGAAASVGQVVNGQFGTFQINADGTFTYTLNNSNATVNALNSGQTLTDSLNYTVTDGLTTDTGTLAITIQGANDPAPIVAVDDTAAITEDATPNTTAGNVLTNDTGGGTKAITAVNGIAGNVGQVVNGQFGTFQINSDGSFTYTLDNTNTMVNALNDGQTLSDAMDYAVGDGNTTDIGTLTITIQGATDGT